MRISGCEAWMGSRGGAKVSLYFWSRTWMHTSFHAWPAVKSHLDYFSLMVFFFSTSVSPSSRPTLDSVYKSRLCSLRQKIIKSSGVLAWHNPIFRQVCFPVRWFFLIALLCGWSPWPERADGKIASMCAACLLFILQTKSLPASYHQTRALVFMCWRLSVSTFGPSLNKEIVSSKGAMNSESGDVFNSL